MDGACCGLSGAGLQCHKCRRWFHPRCLALQVPVLPGDTFYSLTCGDCSGADAFYERLVPSFPNVVHLALFVLHKERGEDTWLSWQNDLCAFLDTYWQFIFGKKNKLSEWRRRVSSTLSTGKGTRFVSGQSVLGEPGWWRLADPKVFPTAPRPKQRALGPDAPVLEFVDDWEGTVGTASITQTADAPAPAPAEPSEDVAMAEEPAPAEPPRKKRILARLRDELEPEYGGTEHGLFPGSAFSISLWDWPTVEAPPGGAPSRPFARKIGLLPARVRPVETMTSAGGRTLPPLWWRLPAGGLPGYPAHLRALGSGVRTIDFAPFQAWHVRDVERLLEITFWPGIRIGDHLEHPHTTAIATWGRLVVGAALMTVDGYLAFLATRPGWEGLGLARRLLFLVLQRAEGDVTLHVSATNPAVFLYRSFGFEVEALATAFYDQFLPPESPLCRHALAMRLRQLPDPRAAQDGAE